MNYIKQLQAEKAEAIDSARTIETETNDLISYLYADKLHIDIRVQVGDVLRIVLPIRNNVTYTVANISKTKSYSTK